jgi:hypothetical protein
MERMIICFLLVAGTAITANAVLADGGCWYNGDLYPIGTRIGSKVCTSSGWRG